MFFESEDLENKLQQLEKKLAEIVISNERLDEEVNAYYQEYGVNETRLSEFISHKENFCEESWEELQAEKKKLDEKFTCALDNVVNLARLKNTYKQRKVETHWLFVR